MKSKYTDILLDLDDTLIDTIENTRQTLVELYDDYNFGNYFPSFDDFYIFQLMSNFPISLILQMINKWVLPYFELFLSDLDYLYHSFLLG